MMMGKKSADGRRVMEELTSKEGNRSTGRDCRLPSKTVRKEKRARERERMKERERERKSERERERERERES